MLRSQITLIAILICCMAFISCSRTQDVLEDAIMVAPPEHHSWMSVELPAPMMTVEEAAAAMNAAGTGQAHGTGMRTVYFNEAAAMANLAEGDKMYPAGSMIIKEVMDDANTMVVHVASMIKTDDPMYMDHGGWIYGIGGNNFAVADSVGCDGCHGKAGEGNDYVFVSLKMDEEMMDAMTGDGMIEGDANGDNGNDGTNGNGNDGT